MKRRSIFPAVILILLGLWFLLGNLNVKLPNMEQIWPVFPMGAGLLALGSYLFERRDPGLIFIGIGATLVGAFFFLFTLPVPLPFAGMREGVRWEHMDQLWPAYVIIGGLAFIALFLAQPHREWPVFSVGAVAIIVGVVAFMFTLGWVAGDIGRWLSKLWPLLLVVAGVAALLQAVFRPRS